MADKFIKKINLGTASVPDLYDIYDEYARRRLEGLTNVYSISCLHEGSSSNNYVDYLTGEAITYSTMAIANTAFNSADETITVEKTTGKTTYIVLESKTTSGAYYAVRFLDMNLGDTVYVIETEVGEIKIPDRWLSSAVEGTSATFKVLDEKIDLKEYAKKTEAAKAGTYTSGAASTETSGQGGAQTATGDASVTYKKADAETGSAGAETITSTEAGAVSIAYTPEGTISGTQTISAHLHKVNLATSEVTYVSAVGDAASAGAHTHSVEVSGDVTLGDMDVKVGTGTANYTPAGTISKPNVNVTAPTVSVNTDAIKAVESEFTGTAATITISGSVTGTTVGDHAAATLTISGTQAIAAHSHSVTSATDTFTAVTGITGFTGGALNAATAKTVVTGVTAASLTGDKTFVKTISEWNGGTLTGTTTFNTDAIKAVVGAKNFGFSASQADIMTAPTVSDGVLSWTAVTAGTQDAHTGTAASTASVGLTGATCTIGNGTVGISGGTASGTVSVVPSYTLTPASLGTITTDTITYVKSVDANTGNAGAATVSGSNFTAALPKMTHSVTQGSFSGSTAYTPAGSISNTYTAAGTTPVVSSVTAALAAAPTFTGTGVRLQVAGGSVSGIMTGTAAEAGAHTHSVSATTATFNNVTGATLNTAGSATVDFTKATFTGTAATLTQAAHTHSVITTAHTHTIGSSDATATGSASVAVSNHTHSIGHTHNTTIPTVQGE